MSNPLNLILANNSNLRYMYMHVLYTLSLCFVVHFLACVHTQCGFVVLYILTLVDFCETIYNHGFIILGRIHPQLNLLLPLPLLVLMEARRRTESEFRVLGIYIYIYVMVKSHIKGNNSAYICDMCTECNIYCFEVQYVHCG